MKRRALFELCELVVEISREAIALYQILKFEGMVGHEGETKAMVSAGQVLLNGKVRTHTRKNIMGMLKKATSGVLAVLSYSRTEGTFRAPKWLWPCWMTFLNIPVSC